jgi:hypothetical protein
VKWEKGVYVMAMAMAITLRNKEIL